MTPSIPRWSRFERWQYVRDLAWFALILALVFAIGYGVIHT